MWRHRPASTRRDLRPDQSPWKARHLSATREFHSASALRVKFVGCIAAILCIGLTLPATADADDDALRQHARQAITSDKAQAHHAIQQLRAAGAEGLDILLETHRDTIAPHVAGGITLKPARGQQNQQGQAEWRRLSHAIDQVAAQKDAHMSGLYWHTDWQRAKHAAIKQNKPILSLRLLGRLDPDRSCANSRFFRTALYPHDRIRKKLSERFILHWQRLRPVPQITIDMGDGREIERTITGNSVHYILAPEGHVLDVIPGMYAPETFLGILELADEMHGTDPSANRLAEHHRTMARRLASRWTRALARHGVDAAAATVPENRDWPTDKQYSYAARANELTPAKQRVQAPFFAALANDQLQQATDDTLWAKLANDYASASRLDGRSVKLMREKTGDRLPAVNADRITASKSVLESPMLRMVRRFQQSIARDTAMNEHLHHRRIYQWLAEQPREATPASVAALNKRIYAELFKAPLDDPWLGLVPTDAYSAIDNRGLDGQR